jgi:transcriptional regulator with XRE-family HTH domain
MRPRNEPTSPYRHFTAALLAYGDTNEAIADALGVSPRQISAYLAGELPRGSFLVQHPDLASALAQDARDRQN